jgi:hypothetical protein
VFITCGIGEETAGSGAFIEESLGIAWQEKLGAREGRAAGAPNGVRF